MFIFALIMSLYPGIPNIASALYGQKRGLFNSLRFINGATISYASLFFIVSYGRFHLVKEFQIFVEIIKYIGSAYMITLAYRVITFDEDYVFPEGIKDSFAEGFLAQWINPNSWSSAVVGVSNFVDSRKSLIEIIGTVLVVGWLCKAIWTYVGSTFSNLLVAPKKNKMFVKSLGVLIAGSAIYILAWS